MEIITDLILFALSASIVYYARVLQIKHRDESAVTKPNPSSDEFEEMPEYAVMMVPPVHEEKINPEILKYDLEMDEITKKLEVTCDKEQRAQLEKQYDDLLHSIVNHVIQKGKEAEISDTMIRLKSDKGDK